MSTAYDKKWLAIVTGAEGTGRGVASGISKTSHDLTLNLPHPVNIRLLYIFIFFNNMNDQEAFAIAIEEAKLSYKEGGVPVFPHYSRLPFLSKEEVT